MKSNDQCYVEQKNGNIVRPVVGYDRLSGELAYRQLAELSRALRLYVNCFQPSMKLQTKERDGSKVRRTYDQAQTPMQRLQVSGILPPHKQHELLRMSEAVDPLRLLMQLEHLRDAALAACSQTRHGLCQSNAWFHAPVFRRKRFTGEATN